MPLPSMIDWIEMQLPSMIEIDTQPLYMIQ